MQGACSASTQRHREACMQGQKDASINASLNELSACDDEVCVLTGSSARDAASAPPHLLSPPLLHPLTHDLGRHFSALQRPVHHVTGSSRTLAGIDAAPLTDVSTQPGHCTGIWHAYEQWRAALQRRRAAVQRSACARENSAHEGRRSHCYCRRPVREGSWRRSSLITHGRRHDGRIEGEERCEPKR